MYIGTEGGSEIATLSLRASLRWKRAKESHLSKLVSKTDNAYLPGANEVSAHCHASCTRRHRSECRLMG